MRGIWGLVAVVLALCVGCSTVDGTAVPPSASNHPALVKPVEVRRVVETAPDIKLRDNAGEEYTLGPVEMRLEQFTRAYIQFSPEGGGYMINLELPGDLAAKFGELTTANVDKRLAMIVDNTVVFAPTVTSPIVGGKVQIQQNYTQQQAKDLLDAIGGER
ncbi:SecDF P1 head subdomain-containing protein [Kibdelosporangium phytohabitans]|uniref:SecDF P1 head subdomain domain-containing protein n=1 Tax=Kibdelosporangium phytohabitans TaxID=860235 RepID=A0A0N7F3U7_9PSEU|nr:hypothetical protein [Kibdelosporangium phytohabitans]ALG09623.1 hypothetical protein AOZ06_24395 [Kibdelosporangium phytohabitans]MBE1469036.1 preprotein translocase subunit SecD [Kibdelosporangium phytohabitans]